LIDVWRGGAAILRVLPAAPGRSRLQRLDYGLRGHKRSAHGDKRDADSRRLLDTWVAQQIELAQSTQTGLAAVGDEVTGTGPVNAALAGFRGSIVALLPHLRAQPGRAT
jgi:hypothetical protein